MRPALFLDRDGTINREVDYLADPDDLELIGDAAAAIAKARRAGLAVVVITNQSGVARGLLSEDDLTAIHARLDALLSAADPDARIDAYYHCPHHPTIGAPPYRTDCDCRKPKAGLLLRAAADLDLDLVQSSMVGDSVRDLDAAREAGVPHRYLVATGKGADQHPRLAPDDHYVADIYAAVTDWLSSPARE